MKFLTTVGVQNVMILLVIFEPIHSSKSHHPKKLFSETISPYEPIVREIQLLPAGNNEKNNSTNAKLDTEPMMSNEEEAVDFALSFIPTNSSTAYPLLKLLLTLSNSSRVAKGYNEFQNVLNDPDTEIESGLVEILLNQSILCRNESDVNYYDVRNDRHQVRHPEFNSAFRSSGMMEKGGSWDNKRKGDEIITGYLMNYTAWFRQIQVQENLSELLPDSIICFNESSSVCNESNTPFPLLPKGIDAYIDPTDNTNLSVNMMDSFISFRESNDAIGLTHQCLIRGNAGLGDSETLVIDIIPLIRLWLQADGSDDKCPKRSKDLETFLFTLMIDGNLMRLEPGPNSFGLALDHEPTLRIHYRMDKRCSVPSREGCKTGACVDADRIYRLRPYCPSADCGVSCDFERPCAWKWNVSGNGVTGFQNMSAAQVIARIQKLGQWNFRGPLMDTNNETDGHFLLLAWENGTAKAEHYSLTSPWFSESQGACNLQATVHMHNMENVALKMVIRTQNHSSYVPMAVLGNGRNRWERLKQMVGKYRQPFQITLEVDNHVGIPSHFAIDNIHLVDCFPSPKSCRTSCTEKEFQCSDGTCIERNQICDLNKDCIFGEDEDQNCDTLPANTTCTFEASWCGWTPLNQFNITWERTNKPIWNDKSGPKVDHTFGNSSGHLLLVNMKVTKTSFRQAVIRSPLFAHPPLYNQNRSSPYFETCQLRFFYHMYGAHVESLDVELVLKNPRNPWAKPIRFCERSGNQGNMWHRAACKLPSIRGSKKYYIQITATRGIRGSVGDVAIDDVSLSPECFGIGVPPSETIGYDYFDILNSPDDNRRNLTAAFRLSTCNTTGRIGPTAEQCNEAYNGTLSSSAITMDPVRTGVQIWTVPETKSYTLIAKGASGGRGALVNQMTSHGSIVKVTMYLRKGEQIFVLVGQEGVSVCEQSNVESRKKDQICKTNSDKYSALAMVQEMRRSPRQSIRDAAPTSKPRPIDDNIKELISVNKLNGGGGGGGGATFVYKMSNNALVPILVAAGGGGLGYNASSYIYPNGRGLNVSLQPHSGSTQPWGAGGGGGWEGQIVKNNNTAEKDIILNRFKQSSQQDNATMLISAGLSLSDGGIGGKPCSASSWGASGGFGGGGGGSTSGGGGGGFVGGNAHVSLSANGEGGWSYIGKGGMYPAVDPGGHGGPGEFIAIPSFPGCGCEHSCVLLDDFEPHSGCVCPENWILSEDGISCVGRDAIPATYLIALIILGVIIFCVVSVLCFCLYNRYQRQKVSMLRRKVMGGPELQLSRLRAQSGPGGVLTEYNPNYEFGGETYTLTDLKEIPRENLRLVKALGQGAFGEVYQGFYRHRDGDAVEMPVAVKTLPELSSNQAEMDFLMEALIMSKFNHPNIVHFIGVCFDKHPRFIILELLAGGDLKTFLRESRPKPDKGTPLSMKDLLLCAIDVAKGCKYLEDNHFIHRDIAARNCLLTTKGPGRVVKIADFGMARDIYRADYYKKGGKAMLPVKWMPPEAFLDGIFTSKTDAWSYGVLLWEIFSLGYMPYPGRGNQDVMQLVTNGGRLEPPSNCPTPIYGMMTQCWHPIPEERPNFGTILERCGYCLQDPEVVNAPLPIFQRPPSSERDTTLMRPPNPDDSSCLRIIHGHHPRSGNPSPLSHNEPLSPNSSTADYLVPLTPLSNPTTPPPPPDSVVTSPSNPQMPESQSTETILDEDDETVDLENETGRDVSIPVPSSKAVSAASTDPKKPNSNGIDSGITLTPASLEMVDKSKRPVPYVNVGAKKKQGAPDEEIRC